MDKVRAHLFIRGRVQGVGYRSFVVHLAYSLGLDGWVKNVIGGGVEAVFEGDKAAIEAAIKKCQEGPVMAIVSDIDVNWNDTLEGLSGFDVRY
jgi:acylphosphatase